MTAQNGVPDLVKGWAAAEERNDAGLVNRSFTITDLQVRHFGTTAVGIGVLAQETSWQGTDNSGRFRVTLVAVPEGEGWRLAHVHIGPLQGPPGSAS
jgi:ketosteroid isomerase-like protein